MNIITILLVIAGLVLVTIIVLSAALASILILGALHLKWVVPATGVWLLLLTWIVVIGYRRRRR